MKVSIIGTVGVPAKYGGFESLVENIIGDNASKGIEYTVYCSSKSYPEKKDSYKGAKLEYVPLNANGSQSIIYDIISLLKATRKSDVILILGVSGCCFLPIYRIFCKKKLVINIDGLEHRRDKWGKWTRRFLKFSEAMAVKYGDVIVADNKGIQDYIQEEYGKNSELIAYGGDHVRREVMLEKEDGVMKKYAVEKESYAFTVCRIEPENNSHVILEAFANSGKQLVFVGNWNHSEYAKDLRVKYANYKNINMAAPEYDLDTLFVLRKNAKYYIHGHSAGGTNPSLVEAMFFGRPILSFDVVYNRETTGNKAYYWTDVASLQQLIEMDSLDGKVMAEMAEEKYLWRTIASQYEQLY